MAAIRPTVGAVAAFGGRIERMRVRGDRIPRPLGARFPPHSMAAIDPGRMQWRPLERIGRIRSGEDRILGPLGARFASSIAAIRPMVDAGE